MNKAALAANFSRACKGAGIEDLQFNNLRHTSITNVAGKFSNIIELSAVKGHRQLSMLERYYHPKAEVLAPKLGC